MKSDVTGSIFAAVHKEDAIIWHQRHPSYGSLFTLSSEHGFELNKRFYECCNVCHRAKQTRNSFPLSDSKATRPFGLIHCDLWVVIELLLILDVIIFYALWMILVELCGCFC